MHHEKQPNYHVPAHVSNLVSCLLGCRAPDHWVARRRTVPVGGRLSRIWPVCCHANRYPSGGRLRLAAVSRPCQEAGSRVGYLRRKGDCPPEVVLYPAPRCRMKLELQDRPAVDVALLVVRVIVGIIFAAHGAQKLFGAFGGPGLAAMVQPPPNGM